MLLGTIAPLRADEDDLPRRFGIKQYPQLYPQDSPRKALASALDAIDKGRYDYLIAHLLDPGFIDEQLKSTYDHFYKIGYDQAQKDGLLKPRPDLKQIKSQIADLARHSNFEYLVRRMKTKHADDPQSLKELRQMLAQGEIQEGGDSAVVRVKELKDRAVYMKKIGEQWVIENRLTEEKE
jgi:hypothetical protein